MALDGCVRCLLSHPMHFTNNRPQGQEVLDWLRENQLSSYAQLFLHYGLDSLLLVAHLSHQQVSRLAEEHGDIELSLGRQIPQIQQRNASTQSELHLMEAISNLEHDPRSRKMNERLEWFEDSAAAWHCCGEPTTPNMPRSLVHSTGLLPKTKTTYTHTLTFFCT